MFEDNSKIVQNLQEKAVRRAEGIYSKCCAMI
jgi:hypothetical protein